MQFFSDHILSVLIAGVVLFVMLSLKFRGEQTSIDATQYRAAKIGTLSLVEVIERDFTNIGSQYLPNMHREIARDTVFLSWDTTAVPARFSFWAQTDSLQPAQRICYFWQEMAGKTAPLKTGPASLYEVTRVVGGIGADCVGGVLSGASTNMITSLEIHPRRAEGTSFTNLQGANMDVRQIIVRLRAVSPLGVSEIIEETRWEKTFRPVNLWKEQ